MQRWLRTRVEAIAARLAPLAETEYAIVDATYQVNRSLDDDRPAELAQLIAAPFVRHGDAWWSAAACVLGDGVAIAAIASHAARRTLSAAPGDVRDGWGDAVHVYAAPAADARESDARGVALAWALATGACDGGIGWVVGIPAAEIAADAIGRSVHQESIVLAAFAEALGWSVWDGSGRARWTTGAHSAAVARTAARARELAARLERRFDGLPGEPCPDCAAPIVDPRPDDNLAFLAADSEPDHVATHSIPLQCSGCGARFASDVNRVYWLAGGNVTYER